MGGCKKGQSPREWVHTDLTVLNLDRILEE